EPPFRAFDESQWVLFVVGRGAWIVTSVPAPLSAVLPAGSSLPGVLPERLASDAVRAEILSAAAVRASRGRGGQADEPLSAVVVLYRAGNQTRALSEGDILVTGESALVFGWLLPPSEVI